MPAVLLSRLERQTTAFSSTFDRPKVFVTDLVALLELYSDRTYQAGYEVPSSSKLLSYRVPSVVIRVLELEFRRLAKKRAKDALLVADELWLGKKLELKELGISLLMVIPLEFSNQVMDRIGNWAITCSDGFLLENLLTKSNQMILREKPSLWLENTRKWLDSKDSKLIMLGLKSLEPLLNSEDFTDLPQIFDSIHSLLLSFSVDVFPEMHHLFEVLCEKNPIETVAFLKQVISEKPVSATFRLIRRISPALPNSLQLSLREAMENANGMLPKSTMPSTRRRKSTAATASIKKK